MCENTRAVLLHVDGSKPVKVYRNLTKKCLSVKQGGIVKCHAKNVVLKDATFVVNDKGRDRVRRENVKNVHAYVKGVLCNPRELDDLLPMWEEVYYNPYMFDAFVEKYRHAPVKSAMYVDLEADQHYADILAFGLGFSK
jgi:hypothetical protein